MSKAKATRRESILIEPYKQLRFGIMFLTINLIFAALVVAIFGYFLWDIYETLSIYFHLDSQENGITLAKLSKPAGIGFTLISLFILTTLLLSAKYTHQIYGPLVSIRRFLDDILAGKLPAPIQLRSSDQLQDLALRLNCMAQKQVKEEGSRQKIIDSCNKLLEGKYEERLSFEASDPYAAIADKLNQLAVKLEQKSAPATKGQ